MKLKPREVSLTLSTPLKTVSLTIGKIWNVSGIMLSSTNSESPLMSTLPFWLKPPKTPRPTEKRWPKSFSKPSTCHHSMSPFKPSFHFMPQEEPPVLSSTLVMVSPTQSPSMKDMLFPTLSNVLILPDVPAQTGFPKLLWNWVWPSHPQPKEKSSEISKKSFATSPSTMKLNLLNTRNLLPTISHMNSPTVTSSPSKTKDSDALNFSSSQVSLVWKLQESTNSLSNPSWSAILMLERTCN